MQATEFRHKNLHVVLLYDPITVSTISVDSIRASTIFKTFSLVSDEAMGGVLALSSEAPKLQVTIQSNRLEYTDATEEPFPNRKLVELWNLLRLLPKFSIKAYGINFFLRISPQHDDSAGRFITNNYIKDSAKLEEKLKLPILSASVRLFLGTPDHHRDLRLAPPDFTTKELILQYHLHREIPIADTDKLKHTIEESFLSSWRECENWYQQLP